MATSKTIVPAVVSKIEDCLKSLKIKSKTESTADESIIYGKFSSDNERFRIVVHIQNEDFIPVNKDFGAIEMDEDDEDDCAITPNLKIQTSNSQLRSYTREEGLRIKKEFLEEASKIIPKLNR